MHPFTELIRNDMKPALGVTEPGAIAFAVSTAASYLTGDIRDVSIRMNSGMYKNALTTAGITDADIIVAGPQEISGTAALVGVFKAYQEMTGETINADIIDASLNELVVTGQLEQSIAGLSDEEVEEFIAYIKSVIAQNDLKDEASINQAIDDACSKYNVTLSDSERQQIVDLLLKITSLGINLDSLVDYAESLYHSFKDGGGDSSVLSSVGTFFSNVFSSIADFFKGLFS